MALTDEGRDFITGAIIGNDPNTATAPILYINANASIGVGDTNTIFLSTQTDLQGAVYGTNKDKTGMDGGYPTIVGNAITFKSTFQTTEANFDWQEWAIFNFIGETVPNTGAGEYMLNRRVESFGIKPNTQSWELTIELTVSAA